MTITERFLEKVDRSVDIGGCWPWLGSTTSKGYGQLSIGGKLKKAHRVAYELMVGPVPPGLQLDHLCRNPRCCNPYHLEPVTSRENTMRGDTIPAHNAQKAACVHGHPFTAANTYWRPDGSRECRTCRLGQLARSRARGFSRTRRPKVQP